MLSQATAVINTSSRQFEVEALLTGLEPVSAAGFESLTDTQGNAVDLSSLAVGAIVRATARFRRCLHPL